MSNRPAAFVVAAPASGHGKTTLTMGLLRALRERGLQVAGRKVGPDYVDPTFHALATGRPCASLDPWAMRRATLDAALDDDADLLIIEGVMGLFDGRAEDGDPAMAATLGAGSTADLAAALGLPVVLVIDARGMGASIAALVAGFRDFRPDVSIAGVILNRIGSERHADLLRAALAPLDVPVLGAVARDSGVALKSRHLGLVPAAEAGAEGRIAAAATAVATGVDLDALVALARPPAALAPAAPDPPVAPLGQRIAVASDDAFRFAYPALLDAWQRAGAALLPFAPLADAPPAAEADAVYLPGGYPELHAGRLAGNRRFLDGLRDAAGRGAWVFGECGGYMALGEALIDADGAAHAMTGLLPLVSSFATRRLTLGYRRAAPTPGTPLGDRVHRGHLFHYATAETTGPADPAFRVLGPAPADVGQRRGRVLGTFLHLVDREDALPLAATG